MALGLLVVAGGDYRGAVLGAVQLRPRLRLDRHHGGRDHRCARRRRGGTAGVARRRRATASRIDIVAPGRDMAGVAGDIWAPTRRTVARPAADRRRDASDDGVADVAVEAGRR